MTRWQGRSLASGLEAAAVFQLVAEMHIVGRPTQIMMGDAITLAPQAPSLGGVVTNARPGRVVMRLDDGRTLHLRPRDPTDSETGFSRPRGRVSSDWTVEWVS